MTDIEVRPAPPADGQAAPATTEQVVSRASSGNDLSYGRRQARGHGYEMRGLQYVPVSRQFEGRFGRMFRLPPYLPTQQRIDEIAELMREHQPDPVHPDPALDNPAIPAGYTYLGQFVDHDLTFDPVSSLTRQNDPDALVSFRSPRFDLDCVYGRGPSDDPFLYQKSSGGTRMLIGHHDDEDDLPRNTEKTALLGDPRNDENIVVSQLQLTMLKFHNTVVDRVEGDPALVHGSESVFDAAQRIVRWHYQWVVVHDFLRRIVGPDMLDSILVDRHGAPSVELRFYGWRNEPFIPVEFSVAAYRFGHSMIRPSYRLNTLVGGREPLPIFIRDKQDPGGVVGPGNLRSNFGGFRILPPLWTIEWARFFEVEGAGSDGLQHSRLIDARIADPLAELPPEVASNPASLISRNLQRGKRLCLPAGQAVAHAMGVPTLSADELGLGGGPAPLWYYILKESEVRAGGRHLGEVGGRIVAEVFLGLLEKDPSSYLRNEPTWTPFLGATPGTFTMPDLIAFAGHGLGVTTLPGGGPGGPGASGGGSGGGSGGAAPGDGSP